MKAKVLKEDGTILVNNLVVAEGFKRYIGLMFRFRMPYDGLLLNIDDTDFIHSFFVFFLFKAIFLDEDFKVVEVCVMKPFTIKRVKASWVLETHPDKDVKVGEKLIIC